MIRVNRTIELLGNILIFYNFTLFFFIILFLPLNPNDQALKSMVYINLLNFSVYLSIKTNFFYYI